MKETSKCHDLRLSWGFFEKYLKGYGIDIGCGPDCLKIPNGEVKPHDWRDGDAQVMFDVGDDEFDFVYSSHCLEDLEDIELALRNWIRICKPKGYLYIAVPDETLYEKRTWPSQFNISHKWSFNMIGQSDLPKSVSLIDFLRGFKSIVLVEMFLNDLNYDYDLPPDKDQTLGKACCQIDFVLQKIY